MAWSGCGCDGTGMHYQIDGRTVSEAEYRREMRYRPDLPDPDSPFPEDYQEPAQALERDGATRLDRLRSWLAECEDDSPGSTLLLLIVVGGLTLASFHLACGWEIP